MKINISNIVENSVVDGEGVRTVLYTQGCTLACKGCQNFAIWNRDGGHSVEVEELAITLVNMSREHHNITIQGGEPTDQPEALQALLYYIRQYDFVSNITLYTGRTWEELDENMQKTLDYICMYVDVLVDGRFEIEKDDPFILWRGSRNQRPIDIKATMESGEIVTLDWELPRLIIAADGTVSMPVGMFKDFAEIGIEQKTRRCGDFRK